MSHSVQSKSSQSSSTLRNIERELTRFSHLCKAAEEAAANSEIETLFDLAFQARQIRHAISTSKEMLVAGIEAEDAELIARARVASTQSQAGDELLHKIHTRSLPDDDNLLSSPLGIISFTEALLPTAWNYEEDLVLLFGNGLDAPADVLRRIGQGRICVYLADNETPQFYPPEVTIIRSILELYALLKNWPRAPTRVVSRSLESCTVSEEEQREVIAATDLYLEYIRVDRATRELFADAWVTQGIKNLPQTLTCPSVANFDDDFVGKPMVIVAPGPSLSKNIKELRKFRGKAIICTFSHTLSCFHAEGIVPDLVLTVDSHPLTYHFNDSEMEKVPAMINGATVCPELFSIPAQHHIAMGANARFDNWLGKLLGEAFVVEAGGSVATTAFSLALRWKCDPIVFVGLDLSFSNGRYYSPTSCDGELRVATSTDGKQLLFDGWSDNCLAMTVGKEESRELIRNRVQLDGYYGGKVDTTQMFLLFHDWFEKRASVADSTTILNCTEGGAYINGMDHIPLSTAYMRHIKDRDVFSVSEIISNRVQTIDPTRTQRAIQGTADIVANLERCLSLIGRCDKTADRIHQGADELEKLEKLEKQLVTSLQGCEFLSFRKLKEIDVAHSRATSANNVDELLRASQDLYRTIRKEITHTLPLLHQSLDQLRGKR